MPVHQYRKRVEVVDAIQYDGGNKTEVLEFAPEVVTENPDGSLQMTPMPAISFVLEIGSWVMKDAGGLYSSLTDDLFDFYYQPGGGAPTTI